MIWGKNSSLLDFYNKILDMKTDNNKNFLDVQGSVKSASFPTAIPKTTCDIETKPNGFGQPVQPRSIGFDDGLVYGNVGTGKKIFKCANSFETMTNTDLEYGQSFDLVEGFVGTIWGVFKTYAGYVVIEYVNEDNSAIWFSTSFADGFAKVATLDRGRANSMNMSFHHGSTLGNDSVCLVSEYGSGSPLPGFERRLFASFDGGATWTVIKTLPPALNDTFNSHWHSHAYDPYDGRIWACNGDGDNSNLFYSYDLGQTWDTVPLSTYTITGLPSHHPQPTMMIPCEDRIVMGPDNGLRPGMLILHKDKKFIDTVENFRYELGYAVYPKLGSATNKYSIPPYATDMNEMYFTVPAVEDHRQCIIMGSGDGGRSWHKVGVLNLSRHTASIINTPNGIVGVDKNGYMFIYFGNNLIARVKKAEWIYS